MDKKRLAIALLVLMVVSLSGCSIASRTASAVQAVCHAVQAVSPI